MLSIGAASGGYYASLAQEDYYHAGGEPPGRWHGRGADALELSGQVDKEQFLRLCDGFSPTGKALTQNAGKEDRRAGYDLCFSAPKSVSVLWALSDEKTRKEIQDAIHEAAKAGVSYLENEAAYTRRGHAGAEVEKCKLAVAMFEHGTSRAQDPQLHVHAVALNLAIREDGTTGAIESKELFRHKMAGGAVFRAEFASQLQRRLGVEIVKGVKDTFEIKGVPKEITEEFSKRRAEIEGAMKKEGAKGAERAAYYTLTTREKKEHVARELLFEKWQEVGKEFWFDPQSVMNQRVEPRDRAKEKAVAVEEAVFKITQGQAFFTEKELVRRTAEAAQTRGLNAKDVLSAVRTYLDSEAIHLGRSGNDRYYTTQEIDALEKRMLSLVEASKRMRYEPAKTEQIALELALNGEQKKALYHITQKEGGVLVVSGMAGTGKTTLLNEARRVWESQGLEVRGAALAAVAAKGLQEGAKIESATLHKTLLEIERGNLKLSEKTVLVIDEAGMVGSRQMARVVDEVAASGARLILVGDERQLQPIEHGSPFKAIGDRLGRAELSDIKRQRDEWAREAVKDFAAGRAEKALQAFAERGQLVVADDKQQAMNALINDWAATGKKREENLILAGTKAETRALNRMAQEMRQVKEELGEKSINVNGQIVFENDRVLFTKNKKLYGVNNGDLGTVKRIDETRGNLTVILDSGQQVRIPVAAYQDIELGYAVTTHKGQGKTVKRAFAMVGGEMDHREFSYVQMSRAREGTRIYTEKAEVGSTVAARAKEMSKSRQKVMAQDMKKDVIKDLLINFVQQQQKGITHDR
jgi:Ti-type conjugative transfer relaxase TraA